MQLATDFRRFAILHNTHCRYFRTLAVRLAAQVFGLFKGPGKPLFWHPLCVSEPTRFPPSKHLKPRQHSPPGSSVRLRRRCCRIFSTYTEPNLSVTAQPYGRLEVLVCVAQSGKPNWQTFGAASSWVNRRPLERYSFDRDNIA